MSQTGRSTASYLPRWLVGELVKSSPESLPRSHSRCGPVMFIDLAGFTPFVVSMCESGQRGIDALQTVMSSFFTALVDEVYRYGGDVYGFSGDAILVGFATEAKETDEQAVRRAINCAVQARVRVKDYESIDILGRTYSMLLKIGISFGRYQYALLGDPSHFTPVCIGPPIQRAIIAESLAEAGDTVIDADMWRHLPEPKSGSEIDSFIKLESSPPFELATEHRREFADTELGKEFVSRCSSFIEPNLFSKTRSGHTGYSGEYREVTVMFARFSGVGTEPELANTIAHMDEIYDFVRHRLDRFQASFNRVELGDKGYVFLILLGAPIAVEAKQEKACRLALELTTAPFEFVESVQVGITTGYGYCGDVGAPGRKDYTVTGNVINLAARLTTLLRGSGIYIDGATQKRIQDTLGTSTVSGVQLKGIDEPVTIYRLETETGDRQQAWLHYSDRMIGREDELAQLLDDARHAVAGEGRVRAIVGEPGIGKSRMLGALLQHIGSYKAESILGFCQFHRRFTPYSCWQPVMKRLIGITSGDNDETSLAKIRRSIATLENVDTEWSPVVAEIIGVRASEQALTRNLDPDQKNRRISQIIFGLLERYIAMTPVILCFEDIHWIDEVSLKLIEYVSRRIDQLALLILLVSREQTSFEVLQNLTPFRLLVFTQMPDEQARELLRERLKLSRADPKIEHEILEKAHGNPFFIESIARSLVEQGLLTENDDGTMRLSGNTRDIRIPFTLQDLILTRIDRLSENEKTVLRIGAVIGRDFSEEAVRSLIPASLSPATLDNVLGRLEALDLTPAASRNPPSYYFKHILIRDVAYETLSLDTRAQLHRRVGEYAENKFADNVTEQADLLAHHFVAGNVADKGLKYSLLAARQARRKFSNQDAIHHFKQSLEILDTSVLPDGNPDRNLIREELAGVYRQAGRYSDAIVGFEQCLNESYDSERQSNLRIGLGHVYQEQGDAARAIEELETALRLLDRRVPRSNMATAFAIVFELVLWGLRSTKVYRRREHNDHSRDKSRKQFDILCLLGKIYFFGNVKKSIWSATVVLNIAEKLGLPKELSLAYANTAVALMAGGLIGKAEKYCTRALSLAHDNNDPSNLAVVYIRTGLLGFYTNQPKRSQRDYQAAADLFCQIGEVWEQQNAMGISTTAYAMDTQFEKAQKIYLEIEELAEELGSKTHLAWAKCYGTFYRYLIGHINAQQATAETEKGIPYAVECDDFGAEIIAYGHLCAIAVREANVLESARLAKITDAILWRNKGRLPARTPQISLVHAGEAALYALQEGADDVQRLLQIASRGSRRAIKLGKNFPYLLGPALRLKATYTVYTKGQKEGRKQFKRAIEVLEQGADKWQAGVGYYEAARWLDSDQQQYVENARSIFSQYSLPVELKRLDALLTKLDTTNTPLKTSNAHRSLQR